MVEILGRQWFLRKKPFGSDSDIPFVTTGIVIDVESYAKRGGTIVTPAARHPNPCVDHHAQDIILTLNHTLDGHDS